VTSARKPTGGHPAQRAAIRHAALVTRLGRVKLFLCDVDGVLTDATVLVDSRGGEAKVFSIRDGLGVVALRRAGIRVGWISSRPSAATRRRANELKVDFLVQQKASKAAAIEGLLAQTGLAWDDVCYAGDDLVDLGPMRRAGVAVAVADAAPETRAAAHAVTRAAGGHGAVREIAEWLLKAQKKWNEVVANYEA
jgi:3-deoxy-D-manno-octulosonate 8-phosphate phosphatase (KDO 8-P phosphatase)